MSASDSCTPGHRSQCPSSTSSLSPYTTIIIYPSTFNTGSSSRSGSSETVVTQPTSTSATPTPTPTPTSSAAPVVLAATSSPNVGAIAGGVIGGVIFLVCIALGTLLYLRARKRKRTAPSSEFINSLRAGDLPVLRLDSGAKYTPALPEKGGYSHHSSSTPFMQNSYYTSPAMEDMKLPDAMMMLSDIPSSRPSVEKPLHPQRFSDQGHMSTSIGIRRELWSSDAETAPSDFPARQSLGRGGHALDEPPRDSVVDEAAGRQSPPRVLSPSLQPLRRQEGT